MTSCTQIGEQPIFFSLFESGQLVPERQPTSRQFADLAPILIRAGLRYSLRS